MVVSRLKEKIVRNKLQVQKEGGRRESLPAAADFKRIPSSEFCSHATIATAIYFAQLMSCMGLSVVFGNTEFHSTL